MFRNILGAESMAVRISSRMPSTKRSAALQKGQPEIVCFSF